MKSDFPSLTEIKQTQLQSILSFPTLNLIKTRGISDEQKPVGLDGWMAKDKEPRHNAETMTLNQVDLQTGKEKAGNVKE
jgi:hypothetical protein